MKIRVTGTNMEAAASARARLYYALLHRRSHVDRVDVQLGDAGGPANGYCLVRVRLAGMPAATIVQMGADLSETIDQAAERAQRLVDGQILAANRAIAGSGRIPA